MVTTDDYYYSPDDYCTTDSNSDSDLDADADADAVPELDRHISDSGFHSVRVITEDSVLAAQREDLSRVMELLSVREHDARTLLIHHLWDVEKLISVYFDKGKARLFSEAGVTVIKNVQSESVSTTLTCNICIDAVPFEDATSMDCGHCFCNYCWTNHFIVKIKDGQSKRIRCMEHNCNAICDESIVRNLVGIKSPELAKKFNRFLLESYIEDNKMVKWCPSVPHCGNALRVENDEFCEVECSCGTQFCFRCTSEAHSPCSCSMWEMWAKKCSEESENVKWIEGNTKPCPKCRRSVEKNGGCNLVYCVCGQAFCYICGEATGTEHTWERIANHSCGRYKDELEKKAKHANKNLYRYIHYYNRYKAHADSSKKELKFAETKISAFEAMDSNIKDVSWLKIAINRLFVSRRALTYSYPFAFYTFGENMFGNEMPEKEVKIKQHLFEDQQQQLEGNIERLSRFLEEPIHQYTEEKIEEVRIRIINLSVATDNRCRKMYECIENDLLGSIECSFQAIAPYQSQGIQKAVILSNGSNSSG